MPAKRLYSKDIEFDTDLFKLEEVDMIKNASWDDKKPIKVPMKHAHFYHTYDSNGRKMTKSASVGGHWHEMSVFVDKDGLLKAKCSQAINTKFGDKHTHKTVYLRSDRLKKRKLNEAAQEYIANFNKPVAENGR